MEFDDAPTRERVARSILELGPSTAAVLGERLDLTPAAVRRHLDHLIEEGAVEAREPRVYGTRGRGLETRYAEILAGSPETEPSVALAEALTQSGYAAAVRESPLGPQLCQQHCPVAHVAHEFPQLCEAETEVFGRLLGRHVQRLATIAHGDGVCTTFIPEKSLVSPQTTDSSNERLSHR